ncbi:MAG: sugar transferase [Microbacteriaceae bacterium]|nr:sugar transferase [Microbacteriaceae bacterium]
MSNTRAAGTDWHRRYARRLAFTDLLVLCWVVIGVQLQWIGVATSRDNVDASSSEVAISYSWVSAAIILGWMFILHFFGSRDSRVLGSGPEEYRRISDASLRLFGLIAIAAFLLKLELARGYVLLALPVGLVFLLISRWIWRQWLAAQRQLGRFTSTVLLVGSAESVGHVADVLRRQVEAGYRVVGACLPDGHGLQTLNGTAIPVLGTFGDLLVVLETSGADTVVVTSSDELSAQRIRELSWSLEPGRHNLVVAPSLTDIGGPRIHTRPVAGLPLIHVEMPRFEGGKQFSKRAFDIVGSALLIAALSPILFAIAILVRMTSAGPALYRQERVGLNGAAFNIFKFRSMALSADSQLGALLLAQGTADTPLFKVQNDPRITTIGAVLRKHSLDEFPQLFNVFLGNMSLVGPRPQRDGEVALYDSAAHRRLFVKPGMSGLWQVSGRSLLSWEDSIRLDLYYVENWSMTGDLLILWRTVKAVFAPGKEAH